MAILILFTTICIFNFFTAVIQAVPQIAPQIDPFGPEYSAGISAEISSLFSTVSKPAPTATALNLPVVSDIATLGDSFSAGPGAGEPFRNSRTCSRYDGALGNLLYQTLQSFPDGGRSSRTFRFIACSGAAIEDMPAQVEQLANTNMDLVTITITGNDAGFSNVLIKCVMFGPLQSSCDAALALASAKINEELQERLTTVLLSIFDNRPQARVFLLSYPHFFNVDTTQCNDAYFGVNKKLSMTQERRQQINGLNDKLNDLLQKTVLDIQGRVPSPWQSPGTLQYLDVSPSFEGHRFCEEGVIEPDRGNPNTFFFHLTTKRVRIAPWLNATLDQSGQSCLDTAYDNSNTTFLDIVRCYEQAGINIGPVWTAALQNNQTDPVSIVFPLGISKTRTFHPRVEGFQAERKAFVEFWDNLNGYHPPSFH